MTPPTKYAASSPIQRFAVLPFNDAPGADAGRSGQIVASIVGTHIAEETSWTMVERERIDDVMGELSLQRQRDFDPKTLVRLGRLMGVDAVVMGNVGQFEIGSIPFLFFLVFDKNVYRVSFSYRIVLVETGEVIAAGTNHGTNISSLEDAAREACQTLHLSFKHEGPQAPSDRVCAPGLPAAKWAVVIGVSDYEYSGQGGLTNLVFADDDARAFAGMLKAMGWEEDHIHVLINEEANRRNILIALESWLTKAQPDDCIILYWAGHGYPDPEDPERVYFACHDTDLRAPVTGYRMDQVRAALEELDTKHVVVIADTCHAGKLVTRGIGGVAVAPHIERMKREKDIPNGWVFMVGAETDRQSIEHTSWANGAFTHCLLEGLSGSADGFQSVGPRDGRVTMGELRTYLNTTMPETTQNVLGVSKHPLITTNTGDPDIWELTLGN